MLGLREEPYLWVLPSSGVCYYVAMTRMCRVAAAVLMWRALCACSEDGPSMGHAGDEHLKTDAGQEVASESALGAEFHRLLRYTVAVPKRRTVKELIAVSAAVAVGRFEDVAEGRIVDYKEGASNPTFTAVFHMVIEEAIHGLEADKLYVEFQRAPIAKVSDFRRHLPTTRLVFIVQRPGWNERTYRFTNEGAGHPEGSTLYTFMNPIGIVAEGDDSLEYPLLHAGEPPPPAPYIFDAHSFEELRAEILALTAAE